MRKALILRVKFFWCEGAILANYGCLLQFINRKVEKWGRKFLGFLSIFIAKSVVISNIFLNPHIQKNIYLCVRKFIQA
jgi:hypothetical protein